MANRIGLFMVRSHMGVCRYGYCGSRFKLSLFLSRQIQSSPKLVLSAAYFL